MKKLVSNLLVVAAGAVVIPSAQAGTIALWDFSTAASGQLNNYAPSSRDLGLSATSTGFSTSGSLTPTVAGGTGGVLKYSWNGNNGSSALNNTVFTINIVSVSGSYKDMIINLADSADKGVTAYGQWAYRLGTSGNFTSIGSLNTLNQNNTSFNASVAGVTLNAGQTLQLQYTLSNPSDNGSGSLSFDNIQLTGTSVVPEPAHYALAAFGLIFVGTGAGRWYRRRTQQV